MGGRNAFYFASRVRIAHSFVMGLLFGKGSALERFKWALYNAFYHGWGLGVFAFSFKAA